MDNHLAKEAQEGQTLKSIEENIAFFRDNLDSYNSNIQNLDTYARIRASINSTIKGTQRLLDIGNGGVFDYDVSLVPHIDGIDLFLDSLPSSFSCPPNVTLTKGDALSIPFSDHRYDGVLMVMLIHHLIGNTVAASVANVRKCIEEAYRVLQPGGKMMIVESCIPSWFYQFEKIMFPIAAKFMDKILGHPATLQYPIPMLKSLLEEHFQKVEVSKIPIGRWVVIYGRKLPSIITPVQPVLFVAEKL